MSAFLVSATKRVLRVDADGREEAADDNPWVAMQLTDPFAPKAARDDDAAVVAGQPAAAGGEAPARPEELVKAFAAAKGELEWLLALLTTLQEGRYLTVGRCEKTQGPQRLVDLAIGANARFRRRSAAAAAAATALSEGAAALAALGRKEDAFYGQVAQLQGYWKVRTEPSDSPYAYSVDLGLGPASSAPADTSSSSSSEPGGAGVGRAPVDVIRILKDQGGMLRVQVATPTVAAPPSVRAKAAEEPPAIYKGPEAIHGLLLQQLRLNAWHNVLASLDAEISQRLGLPRGPRQQPGKAGAGAAGGLRVYAALSNLVLQAAIGSASTAGETAVLEQQQQLLPGAAVAGGSAGPGAAAHSADPRLLSLRPLVLEHCLITQWGHLVSSARRVHGDGLLMAAAAYAATARLMAGRQRQRQEVSQQKDAAAPAAAAGSAGGGPAAAGAAAGGSAAATRLPVLLFGSAASLLTCLSRWLAHSSTRELLRAKLDQQLASLPGVVVRTLHASHACISVVQLAAAGPPACSAPRAAAAAASELALPLLLLLAETTLLLEGGGFDAERSGPALAPASRCRDVQQVGSVQTLPTLLGPLLR